jgi:UPF0271 protein
MDEKFIDINCDVGEGLGNEALLFPHISSCNLACGGHAGNETTMKEVISLAILHGVKVGAHPSYPDTANFGRKTMSLSAEELAESILSQLGVLVDLMQEKGIELHHIKAHGALYNDLARDEELALLYLKILSGYRSGVALYVPYGSVIAREAQKLGFKILYEAFGDRAYEEDLSLVSRTLAKALITSPQTVLRHLLNMIERNKVKTISGVEKTIVANTYCIHGDTANAYEILTYLSAELPKHHIHLAK